MYICIIAICENIITGTYNVQLFYSRSTGVHVYTKNCIIIIKILKLCVVNNTKTQN